MEPFLMKGKVYGEHKHKLVYPVWAEVKYDEIRLHVRADRDEHGAVYGIEFLSYAGKPLFNLDGFKGAFARFFNEHVHLDNLDMGVLVNGNFNDSYRWVRSKNGYPKNKVDKATGKVAPELYPHQVSFYLFDMPDLTHLPFSQRAAMRIEYVSALYKCGLDAYFPAGQRVDSEADLDRLFITTRELGYEGLMVKSNEHFYQPGKRIDGWLKMKPEETFDGRIVGINQAISIHGEPLPRAGSIDVLVLPDGENPASSASPAGIPHGLGGLMYVNPDEYIGRWVEFKCMERDRAGGYRHPSFVRFREDKE